MSAPAEARAKRPRSVTIIAWICVAEGLLVGAGLVYFWKDPEAVREFLEGSIPLAVSLGLSAANTAVGLVGGVGLLLGRNWARLLLVGGGLAAFVLALWIYPFDWGALLDLPILGLIAWFLFSEKADAYFGRSYRRS